MRTDQWAPWLTSPAIVDSRTIRVQGSCACRADAEAESPPATTTEHPPAVDIVGLRAAFKERFGTPGNETPWYRLVTGLKMAPRALVTTATTYGKLEVETKIEPGSFAEGGMCRAIYRLAREFMEEDGELAVAVIASDGSEGGCA